MDKGSVLFDVEVPIFCALNSIFRLHLPSKFRSMQFLHPELLYALFALSIPVIIHLFLFKRFKKVYFTNFSLLKELQIQSRKSAKLRHLLVLLVRILAMAALILAFAEPYLLHRKRNLQAHASTVVNVFVDNSFSMQSRSEEGSLLDEARKKAREIALSYPISQSFRLLTNQSNTFAKPAVNREIFLSQLEQLNTEPSTLYLDRLSSMLDQESDEGSDVFVISDFQKSQARLHEWSSDSLHHFFLIPLKGVVQSNLFVDSLWIEAPFLQQGFAFEIQFNIQNYGPQEWVDVPVNLEVNGVKKAVLTTSLSPFEKKKCTFNFLPDQSGKFMASVHIQDYPISYDDDFFFSFEVQASYSILCISSKTSASEVATYLKSDSTFNPTFIDESQIDFSSFSQYKTLVVNGLSEFSSGFAASVVDFVNQGGNLIVVPSKQSNLKSYNSLLQSLGLPSFQSLDTGQFRLSRIEQQSDEFQSIFTEEVKQNTDFPSSQSRFLMSGNQSSNRVLWSDEAGNPLLVKSIKAIGTSYLFSFDLIETNSNFSHHSLFAPLLFNLFTHTNQFEYSYFVLGQKNSYKHAIPAGCEKMTPSLLMVNDSLSLIPEFRQIQSNWVFSFQQNPQVAGYYSLQCSDSILDILAFNFNRDESFLDYHSEDQILENLKDKLKENLVILDAQHKDLSKQLELDRKGQPLWKLFVLLGFSLLIIELLLLRFRK